MRIGYLALVLALPTVACGGGDGTDESVSGVFPSSAFLGRQVRVEISGDATTWKPGTTVDFGPGVTVQNVAVASPTALFAEITVAPDAAPGLRDVVVTEGGDTLTLTEAFQLESAITLKFRGDAAQGSIATFSINNHDFDTPFDTTSTGDGFFTPIEYTNTFIEGPDGVQLLIDSMEPYSITGIAFFDVGAAPGAVAVHSGLDEDLVISSLGTNLEVAPRTPTVLTAGTPATGMVEKPFSSSLYEFESTAAPGLVTVAATATSQAAAPAVAVLGPSGSFDEFLAFGPTNRLVLEQPGKLYAVYFDQEGGSGYSFSLRSSSEAMTAVSEAEPNNSSANAGIAANLPYLFRAATLSDIDDEDWIGINIAAGDLGKKLRVQTMGNDQLTDTHIEILKADMTTLAADQDNAYHENVLTPALTAAGRYWVKISASSYFDAGHKAYTATVWLE